MDLELAGKVVLVSGGSRGIGLAIARGFQREGCKLAIAARGRAGLASAHAELGTEATIHCVDASRADDCARLAVEVEQAWGRLDVLVCCAGSGASVPPGEESAEEWVRMVNENLFTATHTIAALRDLLARSAPAAVICISSICGQEALGAPVTYSAAKAALDATVKGLSRPLARSGIRINTVSPGNILFPGGTWDRKRQEAPAKVAQMLEREVPMGVLGDPESVADAVLFLASERARFITGAHLTVDGGQTRSLR